MGVQVILLKFHTSATGGSAEKLWLPPPADSTEGIRSPPSGSVHLLSVTSPSAPFPHLHGPARFFNPRLISTATRAGTLPWVPGRSLAARPRPLKFSAAEEWTLAPSVHRGTEGREVVFHCGLLTFLTERPSALCSQPSSTAAPRGASGRGVEGGGGRCAVQQKESCDTDILA